MKTKFLIGLGWSISMGSIWSSAFLYNNLPEGYKFWVGCSALFGVISGLFLLAAGVAQQE